MFEGAVTAYQEVKKTIKDKWEGFKKKFEETKSEMSQEVMKAETPEDLIALGKKLQEQGETLKAEQGELEKEEAEDKEMAAEMGKEYDEETAYQNATEKTKKDQKKELAGAVAEEYDQEIETQKAEAKQLEMDKQNQAAEDAAAAEEILKKLQGGEAEVVPDAPAEQSRVESAEPVQRENIKQNMTFRDLKIAFDERNMPGNFNAGAEERWKKLSKDLVPQLSTVEDMEAAKFYLTNEDRQAVDMKWDELSKEQVQNAKTEEEIIHALNFVRPGGFDGPMKLREEARGKLRALVGAEKYNSMRSSLPDIGRGGNMLK